jgi:hypothetical protein
LDRFTVEQEKLQVEVEAPATVRMGTQFPVTYTFVNTSIETMECKIIVQTTDDFFLIGEVGARCIIGKDKRHQMKLQVMGLKVGYCRLPPVNLTVGQSGSKGSEEVVDPKLNYFINVTP